MKFKIIKFAVIFMFLCINQQLFALDDQSKKTIDAYSGKLSDAQIEQYFRDGYLVIPKFFTKDEVNIALNIAHKLQSEAETLSLTKTGKVMHNGTQFVIDRKNDHLQLHRIVWAAATEPELLKISRQSKLLVPIAQLLDSNKANHIINQLHYKLPKDDVKFDWHQDLQHRRNFDKNWRDLNGKGSFVQSIIALEAASVENGAIFVIPASHNDGDLHIDNMTDFAELKQKVDMNKSVPLVMQPGDLVLMHPLLVHGSKANKSNRSRITLINGFSYPGANSEPYPGVGSTELIDLLDKS